MKIIFRKVLHLKSSIFSITNSLNILIMNSEKLKFCSFIQTIYSIILETFIHSFSLRSLFPSVFICIFVLWLTKTLLFLKYDNNNNNYNMHVETILNKLIHLIFF